MTSNNNLEENGYTPATIGGLAFSIPLYQRLFEWEKEQISKLLEDLKDSFEKNKDKPYYIGMVTVYENGGRYDLVDGQQRFTVMMLMGVAFGWEKFVKVKVKDKDELRLTFFAREQDKKYLENKVNNPDNKENYINSKMEEGIEVMKEFINKDNFFKDENKNKKKEFEEYIYKHMTFFVSELPSSYKSSDLNSYFEAMNATGKGLENHEILKVKLLQKLKDCHQATCTKIWNRVSDMGESLINEDWDKITIENIRSKSLKTTNDDKGNEESIGKIYDENPKNPSDRTFKASSEQSIISFPEFLLLVLRLQLQEDKGSFSFNTLKLIETFENTLLNEKEEVTSFFKNLFKYRLLFDWFVIKRKNKETSKEVEYTLSFNEKDEEEKAKKKLIQYQSMLHVSSSFTVWLPEYMKHLNDKNDNKDVGVVGLLEKLKNQDNRRRTLPELGELRYNNNIDRYWFWRLDYYLWEKVNDGTVKIEEGYKSIIDNYKFRENRSIEHLYPQNPQSDQNNGWEEENYSIHSFGNLALISSSFNSTQSNDEVGVKFARVKGQIDRENLESIKLLMMYLQAEGKDSEWSPVLAKEHGKLMYSILKESFPSEENS